MVAWLIALLLGAMVVAPVRAQAPPPPPDMIAPTNPTPAPDMTPAPQPSADPIPTTAARATPADVFRLDFMQRALVAGGVVGLVCGYLGLFVVLRRVVFVGMALAEFSSLGVAVALLKDLPLLPGSVGGMLLGTGLLSVRWSERKVRPDAVLGIGYVLASALTILILAKSPNGEAHLLDILSGNILTVSPGEVAGTCVALGLVLLLHRLLAKEFLFVAYDPDTAHASGYATRVWETLLTLSIGIAIAFAIRAVGILLTFGTLVIPAIAALLATRRMASAFLVAPLLGLLAVPTGLYISFVGDYSPGATIVAVECLLLALAALWGRLQR